MYKLFRRFFTSIILVLGLFSLLLTLPVNPAWATVRNLEEKPGQMLYQSRQTLLDNQGNTWQVVLFKRVKSDQSTVTNLRLVGFPERDRFQHPAPLIVATSPQNLTELRDVFATESPEENVGQYDLAPVLGQLAMNNFWQLQLPLENPVTITVPYYVQQEWQLVAPLSPLTEEKKR
jgi:hypothetical protein